jgi:uncharacterized protein (DUF58 family)
MNNPAEELFKTIRRIQIQTTHLADDVLAGAYHSAFKGKGIEFEEVREYLPGDDIRSIDWNVTARMSHPVVKLFKEERELTVLLMIDISSSCRFGKTEKSKRRLIAEMGALLAFSAIKNNDKVGLLLFSEGTEKYLPPRKGLRHVLRVIRELLFYTPRKKGTNVAQALAFAGKLHRRSAVCFVISDFISPSFENQWMLLAQRHDLIAVHVSDPYEKQFPDVGLAVMEDLETGLKSIIDTKAERVQTAVKEHALGAQERLKSLCHRAKTGLIEASTDRPLLAILKKFFKQRSQQWR